MRHLHAGHDHGGAARPRAAPRRRQIARGAGRQSVPLHRLRQRSTARSRRPRSRRRAAAPDARQDALPVAARRSRADAAAAAPPARRAAHAARRRPLDADGRLHRRLRRPAIRHAARHALPRPLGARRAARHQRATATCFASARWRRTPRSSASPLVRSAAADARAARARSAACRSRTAARSAATSPTRRPPATRCRCWRPPTPASCCGARRRAHACRSTRFYTGYRTTVLRPDELIVGDRDPAARRPAVVPQGRHARGAGDLEGVMAGVRGDAAAHRLGSVAPTVVRAAADRARARGRARASPRRSACSLAEIAPIDDVRSTAEYRRRVAANLLARFWPDGMIRFLFALAPFSAGIASALDGGRRAAAAAPLTTWTSPPCAPGCRHRR